MAGFALSTGEISSICRNLAAQMRGIPDRITEIRSSEIMPSDFGGRRYADLAERYIEATQDAIPKLLRRYAAEGAAMADRLEATLGSYTDTDDGAAALLHGLDGQVE